MDPPIEGLQAAITKINSDEYIDFISEFTEKANICVCVGAEKDAFYYQKGTKYFITRSGANTAQSRPKGRSAHAHAYSGMYSAQGVGGAPDDLTKMIKMRLDASPQKLVMSGDAFQLTQQ
jgi:hypothetical protein